MIKNLIIYIFLACILSCGIGTNNVDIVIKKYDSVDFSALKNKAVSFRSRGNSENSSIYLVSDYKSDCSPYFVEVNNSNDSIVNIKDNLVISSCGKGYLTRGEITAALKNYFKYHFCVLQVDAEGNIY